MFDVPDLGVAGWTAVAAFSVLVFVGSIFLMYRIIVRLPADHFCVDAEERARRRGGLWRRIGKNLAGALVVVLGGVMLFTPGQGLLTILLGVSLLDFPGRVRFERWLIGRPRVLSTINGWRRRAGQPPMMVSQ